MIFIGIILIIFGIIKISIIGQLDKDNLVESVFDIPNPQKAVEIAIGVLLIDSILTLFGGIIIIYS